MFFMSNRKALSLYPYLIEKSSSYANSFFIFLFSSFKKSRTPEHWLLNTFHSLLWVNLPVPVYVACRAEINHTQIIRWIICRGISRKSALFESIFLLLLLEFFENESIEIRFFSQHFSSLFQMIFFFFCWEFDIQDEKPQEKKLTIGFIRLN